MLKFGSMVAAGSNEEARAEAREEARAEIHRPARGISHSPEKIRLIASLLLLLVTLALYSPVARDPYLNYDDNAYVYENFHVRAGLTWQTAVWAFTTHAESNWHPLTWISHALDVTLFGLNPAGAHDVNVLLHAINAVLLFLLLDAATGVLWPSLAVAALFAVHPINVESVAWIAERKNVLSALFFLGGLLAYLWYARKPGVARYFAVFACSALGLMAKPQVITFPCVLLLLDYWPLRRLRVKSTHQEFLDERRHQNLNQELDQNLNQQRLNEESNRESDHTRASRHSWPQLVLEKVPLFMLSAASAWITMKAQSGAIHLEYPLSARLENAVLSYAKYIGKTFWPAGLAPLYPHPGLAVNATHAAFAAALLVSVTAAVFLSRRPYLIVGWLWFLGTLVPMIGLVQVGVQAIADRYAYLPLIGLFVMVCWGVGDLSAKMLANSRIASAMSCFAAAGILASLIFVTHRQIGFWRDNLALWTHTIEVTQKNYIAEDSIAEALEREGKLDEAAVHVENAVRINPADPIANLNLGAYEQQKGNYSSAIAYDQATLRLTQNQRLRATAFTNLGYAYYSQKQFDSARQSFNAALAEQAMNPQAWLGLGLVESRSGNMTLAAEDDAKALRLEPSDLGYLLLADALEKTGQRDSANAARQQAARLSPDLNQATEQAQRLLGR